MCSSGRPAAHASSHGSNRSGSQYALCALGVGLIALGIIMIVWTIVPQDGEGSHSQNPGNTTANTTTTQDPGNNQAADGEKGKVKASSSVAYVLVGAGAAMLLLSICLGVRNKRKENQRARDTVVVGASLMDHVAGAPEGAGEPAPTYDVPSYEEAVGSGQYPIRQSNLRNSTSQLPSYEDLISAVEAEGEGPSAKPAGEAPPAPAASDAPSQPVPRPATSHPPSRSSSRASRILRPLRVRRIKSEKLHLKDFRLNLRNPAQTRVTIEPITPPPLYDDKPPEF